MGVQTHTAARIYKGQKKGQTGEEEILAWEKFPYSGQSKTYNTDYVLGLFAYNSMNFILDRESDKEPSLDVMTKEAILRLRQHPQGFFLVVEGARIDQAHHQNLAKKALEETLELEKAVEYAKELTNEEETLIVVTADHSHAMTINGYPKRGNPILGYVYDEERQFYHLQPDGTKSAYATLSYANGVGFDHHFTNNSQRPWKDLTDMNYNKSEYHAPGELPALSY